MKVTYSDHAVQRIKQRSLSRNQIRLVLKYPDKIVPSFKGRTLANKAFNSKVLEVIYKKSGSDVFIITAYWLTEVR